MSEIEKIEFEDEEDSAVPEDSISRFSEAVLYSTDWTVETILSQLARNNIQLNPNFQRRDAWSNSRKSVFIESIIIGLPVPQLVLAELREERGKYIVLDGKQRLLSIMKYTESQDDKKSGFALSGLEARKDLSRIKYYKLYRDGDLVGELNSFLNYSIRTVIIRNWPNRDFLYQVFLRLNTGSVKLSPQELRQAMAPGEFSTFADERAADSDAVRLLLGRSDPDPRMRDVELLVRHLSFRNHINEYSGRMKEFLDNVCIEENKSWEKRRDYIISCADEFDLAILSLIEIFGESGIARKPNSKSFNRAIFDALSFYGVNETIRDRSKEFAENVRIAYDRMFDSDEFNEAIESDTAGIPNTFSRLSIWGAELSRAIEFEFNLPRLENGRIVFEGF